MHTEKLALSTLFGGPILSRFTLQMFFHIVSRIGQLAESIENKRVRDLELCQSVTTPLICSITLMIYLQSSMLYI